MLPWLGFVPDRVVTAPLVAVARLAERLKVDPAEIGSYGRGQTRTEHLRLVARYLGWRSAVAKGRPMAARALWIRSATPRAARRSNRCGAFRRSTPRAISDADELVGLRRKARRRELGE